MEALPEQSNGHKINLFTLSDFEYIYEVTLGSLKKYCKKYNNQDLETLGENFVREVFKNLEPNVLINGLPYDMATSMSESYEPISQELAAKLDEVSAERNDLITEVAKLRSKAPSIIYDMVYKNHKSSFQEEEVQVSPINEISTAKYEDNFFGSYAKAVEKNLYLCSAISLLNERLEKTSKLVGGDEHSGQ